MNPVDRNFTLVVNDKDLNEDKTPSEGGPVDEIKARVTLTPKLLHSPQRDSTQQLTGTFS